MTHTEFDELELEEETAILVGATSVKDFQLEQKKITALKQNLKCGFCDKPFSEVPRMGYLYPHTKMEDATDGRNACENCYPIEFAAALEAGLIHQVVEAKHRRESEVEEPVPVKLKRGRPRKVRPVVESKSVSS